MAKQNIARMAKANGVNPSTAHNRILKGWTTEAATSTPARKYSRSKTKYAHGQKAEVVWAHVVANPLARPVDVANATGVSYGYVHKLMSKVGTPREVFEREAELIAGPRPTEPQSSGRTRNIIIGTTIFVVIAAWMVAALGV